MIYDPHRRALELRQRIIESMTAEELEEYARRLVSDHSQIDLQSSAELPKAPPLPGQKKTLRRTRPG
jgi:hypothetical protein